jgi:hypothetical protein
MLGPDSRQDSHPIDHVDGRTSDVDRIAAGADGWGALDERHVETVPYQPIGQGRAGDARARHEDSSGMSAIHDSRFSGRAARRLSTGSSTHPDEMQPPGTRLHLAFNGPSTGRLMGEEVENPVGTIPFSNLSVATCG